MLHFLSTNRKPITLGPESTNPSATILWVWSIVGRKKTVNSSTHFYDRYVNKYTVKPVTMGHHCDRPCASLTETVIWIHYIFRTPAHHPPLPAMFLSNVCALKNKIDELVYLMKTRQNFMERSLYCFTETWLGPSIPNSAVEPPGYTLHRADCLPDLSGKCEFHGSSMVV